MAIITLRSVKGAPLTNTELDGNFSNVNSEIGVLSNLATTAKGNLVAALNEIVATGPSNVAITGGTIVGVSNVAVSGNVYATAYYGDGSHLTGVSVDTTRIISGNTSVAIAAVDGSIFANVAGNTIITVSKVGGHSNVKIAGNLQDNTGRTLRILDESNVVIWGS